MRTYCHCFFGLADGGALAFFQFAEKSDERKFSPPIAETPFHHIALKVDEVTQETIEKRIKAAGLRWNSCSFKGVRRVEVPGERIHPA